MNSRPNDNGIDIAIFQNWGGSSWIGTGAKLKLWVEQNRAEQNLKRV